MCKAAGPQQRESVWSKTRGSEGTCKQLLEEEQLSIKKLTVRNPRKQETGMSLKKPLACPRKRQLWTFVNTSRFKHPLWSEETNVNFTSAVRLGPACLPSPSLFLPPLQSCKSQPSDWVWMGGGDVRKPLPAPSPDAGFPPSKGLNRVGEKLEIWIKCGFLIITQNWTC